jgi:hypothetical protein
VLVAGATRRAARGAARANHIAEVQEMKGRITVAAALAVTSLGLGTGLAIKGAPAVPAAQAAEDTTVRQVEGRVLEVRREGGAAELRLDDGTRLTLLAPEERTADRVLPGTRVEAEYRESAGDNIVIHLRAVPETQAP